MFERFSRSWSLVKASADVLRQDKELLVFPLLSTIAALLVAATFIAPAIGLGWIGQLEEQQGFSPLMAAYGFLFYLVQYFVIFYFNTALVGAAMIRLDGGDPTVGDGLRIAGSKLGPILGYAALAATVGMILRAIQERAGFIGRWVAGLLGLAWTVATFLVVPVLVTRDVGPVDAVKESAMLLKKTWGENIAGQAGLGLAFGLIQFGIIIGGILLVVAAAMTQNMPLTILTAALVVVAVLVTALIHAALAGIYSAALYRYASGGEDTAGFNTAVLRQAFLPAK